MPQKKSGTPQENRMDRADLTSLVSAILASRVVDSQTSARVIVEKYREILREMRKTGGPTTGQAKAPKMKGTESAKGSASAIEMDDE